MKFATPIIAASALLLFALPGRGNGYVPGEYDGEALRLLRSMSESIPLRTTELKNIAPEFAVEKRDGLSWAEADARFGQRQPERSAFLRKYLAEGSSETQLKELQLPSSGASSSTGSAKSVGFIVGPPQNPVATIVGWIAQGNLIGAPTLDLLTARVNGVVYNYLSFDVGDRLVSAYQQFPRDKKGSTLRLGENTSGSGGVNFYWAQISGPNGESEWINFTPELVIKERSVSSRNQQTFMEVYEDGKLRKRKHYNQRQTKNGTESFIEREESFP